MSTIVCACTAGMGDFAADGMAARMKVPPLPSQPLLEEPFYLGICYDLAELPWWSSNIL